MRRRSLPRRLIGPILLLYVVFSWVTNGGWLFAAQVAVVFVLVVVGSIVVHEGGHALVGALVGYRVVRVVSGRGPRLLAVTLGGTEVEIRILPTGGVTHLAARDRESVRGALRFRHFLAVAAGPAATIALAVWGTALVPDSWGLWQVTDNGGRLGFDVGGLLRGWNIWAAIVNLLPYGGTDGAVLVWLLKSSRADVDDLGDRFAAAEAGFHALDGDTDRALAASEGIDATSPNSAAVLNRAGVLLMAGRHAEGRELLCALVDRPMPVERQALAANNLAWADVNLGDPALLDEADHYSAHALALVDEPPAAMYGTRARVLAELRRFPEALEAVGDALARDEGRGGDRGEFLATRAMVRLETGDALGARRDADLSVSLAPDSAGAARIRARVDLRSLALAAEPSTVGPDGTVDAPEWLWARQARSTREGAVRALREGDRAAVEVVLDAAGFGDRGDEAADAFRDAISASVPPARRPAGR